MNTSIRKAIMLSIAILILIIGCKKTSTSSDEPSNNNPTISSFTISPTTIAANGLAIIRVSASDEDGDAMSYNFTSDGSISGTGPKPIWVAPNAAGTYAIELTVSDGNGGESTQTINITVTAPITQIVGIVQFVAGSTGDLMGAKVNIYKSLVDWNYFTIYKTIEITESGSRVPFTMTDIPVGDDYRLEISKDCDSNGNISSTGDFLGCYGSVNTQGQVWRSNPTVFQVSNNETARCDARINIVP